MRGRIYEMPFVRGGTGALLRPVLLTSVLVSGLDASDLGFVVQRVLPVSLRPASNLVGAPWST